MTELSDVYRDAAKLAVKELFEEKKITKAELAELLGKNEAVVQ